MSVNAQVMNDLLSERLDNPAERTKLAAYAGDYIRDRLREESFARKVIPPKQVTKDECQVSVNHDTLVKIIEVAPNSRAMSMSFRGEPTTRLVRAPRAEVSFFTISSEKFEKPEQELLAYQMPITKIIEDNSVKDIQEIEDREFLIHTEACIQALQFEANGNAYVAFNRTNFNAGTAVSAGVVKGSLALAAGGVDDFIVRDLQRRDIVTVRKLLSANRLRPDRLLMTEPDWDTIGTWTTEDMGDKIESETLVDGYTYNTLLGLNVIRTIKTDILRPGNVYLFAAPEFFGKFFILNNTKFYIDKKVNIISWQAWEDVGMGLINIAGVRKLELFRGSLTTDATGGDTNKDVGFATAEPVEEEVLAAENNRVDQGIHFPNIASF